ncbi:MAG TPA: hypothetical protein VKB76_05585, partial [Ktedonobacterales bacterium]|nr:hypothetical protein [Ktedonobacterales bacterium]
PIASPSAARAVRPLPWVAFASAGAVAVAALLGWSVLAGSSASPNVPINGSIEQQVPFGPVKIVPRSPSQPRTAVKPATAPPAHPVAAAPTATSAHGRVPAKPKTTTRHVAHSAHRTRQQTADDEVVVHHYATPKPQTQAKATNNGVKHISDQE